MRRFVAEPLMQRLPETAPQPPIGVQAMTTVQKDWDLSDFAVFPNRTMTPVGRWLTPIGTDLRWAQADDVGRYPMAPNLMGFKSPKMPGHHPGGPWEFQGQEGLFPNPVLNESLYNLDAARTAPGTWAIPRTRFYGQNTRILPRAPAYRMGPIAPNIVGGNAFGLTPEAQERVREAGRQTGQAASVLAFVALLAVVVWWGAKA